MTGAQNTHSKTNDRRRQRARQITKRLIHTGYKKRDRADAEYAAATFGVPPGLLIVYPWFVLERDTILSTSFKGGVS